MVAKVTISLPEELLAKLDAEAASAGASRSWVAQEAMAGYLSQTAEQREAAERMRRADDLMERLLHFEDGLEIRDDRPSLEILREVRATDDSAPMRDVRRKAGR
jgi:predicted transcriptional regulator